MSERFERPRTRLAAFAVVLGVALAGGYGLGAALSGDGPEGDRAPVSHHTPAPHHTDDGGTR